MTQPTVTLLREVVQQAIEALALSRNGLEWYAAECFGALDKSNDETFDTIDISLCALRAALDAPQAAPDMVEENDKAVGKKWREDSRLEAWFPITAEKLAALEVEVHKLRMRHPLGEAVAWRRWNNKWHEYDYAGSPQLDGGSLFDWEPLAAVPRAALDAPAKPPCQMCMNSFTNSRSALVCGIAVHCTDFDKFQALPPIVLTKVTK